MAKVYLDSGDNFTLSGAASVYGSTGTEKVVVNTGVTGVVVDANVERVDLPGASSAFTFKQAGNQLQVFSGATVVATIPLQDDANGTQIVFSNGSVDAKLVAGTPLTITLGGATVPSAAAAAVTPTTIDATVTSGSGSSTGGTSTTGQAFTLTNSTTTPDSPSLTAGNDTVTGATGTLQTADIIVDGSSTDVDTLNAAVSGYVAGTKPTIIKVENVNIAGDFSTTGLDLDSVTGTTTLTLSTGIIAGTATVTAAAASKVGTITAGTNIATLNVSTLAGGTTGNVTVNTGSATNETVLGGAGVDTLTVVAGTAASALTFDGAGGADVLALTLKGGAVTFTGSANNEVLTINSSTAANTLNVGSSAVINGTYAAASTNKVTVSGDQDLTINATAAQLDGLAIAKAAGYAKTLTAKISTVDAARDLSKVEVSSLEVAGANTAAATLTVNENSTVVLNGDATSGFDATFDAKKADSAATQATTLNLKLGASQTANGIVLAAGLDTVALSATAASTINALTTNVATVSISGSNDITITTLTNTANDVISASALTGKLTIGSLAAAATVVGGSGADSITASSGADLLQGGAGNDTFVFGASRLTATDSVGGGDGTDILKLNVSTAVADTAFTNVSTTETVNVTTGGATLTLGTKAEAAGIVTVTSADVASIDANASAYVTAGVTMTGAATNATTLVGGGGNDTITGGTAADTITTGNGNNVVVTGNGGDTVTFGTGTDSATGGTGVDTFVFGTSLTSADTVAGGANTDVISVSGTVLDSAFTKVTSVETLTLSAASTVTIGTLATAAGITTVNAAVGAASTIDASASIQALTIAGNTGADIIKGGTNIDTITSTAASGGDTITGGAGNDVITLGTTSGSDTIVFSSTPAANGADTINEFLTTGTDKLDFTAFLGGAAGVATTPLSFTAGTLDLTATGTNVGVVFNKASLAAGDIATATATSKIAVEDNSKAVVLVTADADGTSDTTVTNYLAYYVQDTDAATGSQTWVVTLVGTLVNATELGAGAVAAAAVYA